MKKFLRTGLWLLLACASSSHAVIVDCDAALGLDCTIELDLSGAFPNATKIFNLETSPGVFYDVVYDYVAVGDTSDPRDVFVGDFDAAQAAANLLAAVLNPTVALTAKASGSEATGQNFNVMYSYAGDSSSSCTTGLVIACGFRVSSSFVPGPTTWGVVSAELESGDVNFARFTPAAPVPLPPAAFLFGSGLLAILGWARRRPGGAVSS